MTPERLKSLLGAGVADRPGRSPDCPDEHEIAAYADGTLDALSSERLERHLADCESCCALIGLLSRARDETALPAVPESILAQARAHKTTKAHPRWRQAPRWAAAAVMLLAVPLLVQLGQRNHSLGTEGQGRPIERTTRNLGVTASPLQVLAPLSGSEVTVDKLQFRWARVPGSSYYDVRIVTDAGDVVIEQRVTGTEWRPPQALPLRPGAEYYVHVDAYPSGDKAVSSEHVPFRVVN